MNYSKNRKYGSDYFFDDDDYNFNNYNNRFRNEGLIERFSNFSIKDQADELMQDNIDDEDDRKKSQKISFIHQDLNFRRNSLNLLVGKRGSGKTYNVIREVIKVGLLPNKGDYSIFVVVSDQENDSTINEQKRRIKFKMIHTNYENAYKVLSDIKEGKTAYDQVIQNNLENKLTEKSREEILKRTGDNNFKYDVPSTLILFDDAINIFKSKKYERLSQEIFRSRQPKFTIFLCVQDFFGIPPNLRRNVDSFWLFGGFTDDKYFNRIFGEMFNTDKEEKRKYWEEYRNFSEYEALYIDFHKKPIVVEMISK